MSQRLWKPEDKRQSGCSLPTFMQVPWFKVRWSGLQLVSLTSLSPISTPLGFYETVSLIDAWASQFS